jgi:hypothetical protein
MVQENNYNRMQSLRTVGAGINIGNYAIGDATPEECLELLLENPDVNVLTDAEYASIDSLVSLTPAENDFYQFKSGDWTNRTPAQVKIDLGINNVDNTSDANKPLSTASINALALKADLVGGKVPSAQLPSYVDDVLMFPNFASFPVTGETGILYVDESSVPNPSYRWSGSSYVIVGNTLTLGETSITAYRGDRGKIAYDHSQTTHDKAFVGLPNVDNTSDANKPVSTAQQTALNLKVALAGSETITGLKTFDVAGVNSDIKIDVGITMWGSSVNPSMVYNAELVVGNWRYINNGYAYLYQYDTTTGVMNHYTAPNGVAGNIISWGLPKIEITNAGILVLNNGQLKFPAVQNPSADANTLDDYKTNITWTPVDASGAGLSLTITNAKAVKIGDIVHVWADITFPATADTTAVAIGGLPYLPSANTGAINMCRITTTGITDVIEGFATTSGTLVFRVNGVNLQNVDLTIKRFIVSLTYFV